MSRFCAHTRRSQTSIEAVFTSSLLFYLMRFLSTLLLFSSLFPPFLDCALRATVRLCERRQAAKQVKPHPLCVMLACFLFLILVFWLRRGPFLGREDAACTRSTTATLLVTERRPSFPFSCCLTLVESRPLSNPPPAPFIF